MKINMYTQRLTSKEFVRMETLTYTVLRRVLLIVVALIVGVVFCWQPRQIWLRTTLAEVPDAPEVSHPAQMIMTFENPLLTPTKLSRQFTLVTAFYNLDRTRWTSGGRNMSVYMQNFEKVAGFNNHMVIYAAATSMPGIRKIRERVKWPSSQTMYVECPLEQLPYYSELQTAETIMASTAYKSAIGSRLIDLPEYKIALYDILMWAKVALLGQVARSNPFKTSHFAWIDFGSHSHFHGRSRQLTVSNPEQHNAGPPVEGSGRVQCLALEDPRKVVPSYPMAIAAAHHDVIIGPVFGGTRAAVTALDHEFNTSVKDFLAQGVVSDDQDVLLYTFFRRPDIFQCRVLPDGWSMIFDHFNS